MSRTRAPKRRTLLLLGLALLWLAVQGATVDLAAVLTGFGLHRATSETHHAYALANVGAWLAVIIGATIFVFQRGRWRTFLLALLVGAGAAMLQGYGILRFGELARDPARPFDVGTLAIGFSASEADSATAAALSTAVLGLFAALVGYATGVRGGSTLVEARRSVIVLARALRPRNFNVFSWLFGPVFQADVRVTGRRTTTYLARGAYLLILLAIVTIAWFGMRQDIDYYDGAERLLRMQELAPTMARFLVWTQFILLLFIAPLLTAPVICQERTGRTLPALLTTPLNGAQIVFGKLAGRLMMAIILILLSVPLLLGIRVYGGLDTGFVLKAVAVTISATIFAASLGILASIWSKRVTTAAVMAFVMLAAHSIGIPLLIGFVLVRVTNAPPGWVFTLSPIMSLALLTFEAAGNPAPFASPDNWMYNVAMNLGLAAATCLVATAAFRRVMIAEAHGQTLVVKHRRKRSPAAAQPATAQPADAGATSLAADAATTELLASHASEHDDGGEEFIERASRKVGDNPVLWREIRQTALGGGSRVRSVIVTAAAVAGLLLLNLYFGPAEKALHFIILACGMILLCAGAAVAASGAISSEREAGSWPILLTTPMSGTQILLGKFLGACRRCWIAPALLFLDGFIAVASGAFRPVFLLHLAIIIPATIVFLCGTGALFSAFFRKTTMAGVVNLGLGVCLWLGFPMFIGFLIVVTGAESDAEWLFTGAFSISPVALSLFALAGAEPSWYPDFEPYDMPGGQMGTVAFTFLVVIGMGLLALAGLGALALASARLLVGPDRTS